MINDEIGAFPMHGKETSGRNYPLRRQSAISDFKPKVSKWTKVKAAFKWEKTSALPANEIKSSEAMMIPVNNEVARYVGSLLTGWSVCFFNSPTIDPSFIADTLGYRRYRASEVPGIPCLALHRGSSSAVDRHLVHRARTVWPARRKI